MRLRVAAAVLLGLAAACAAPRESVEATSRPPNVVLILADDLGIGDLRAYNPASKVPTPRLDALASEGLRLTDMHTPSAVCSPTRYGLLTGRYAWRGELKSGVLWGSSPYLIEPERPTLATMLRARGYRTGAFGKWHLGLGANETTDFAAELAPGPLEAGFDTFFGIPASLDMPPYLYVVDRGVEAPASETVAGSAHRRQDGGGFWRAGAIAPGFEFDGVLPRVVDESLEWLRKGSERGDAPFFLYLPLTAPHTPWVPTADLHGASEAGWYGDFVAQVDFEIGRVLDELERLGVADDTLVIVTSDNGAHWPDADVARFGHDANAGLRGQKADIFEGGHRVPFVARWPGRVPAGEVRDDLAGLTDLFATLATLTGEPWGGEGAEDSLDLAPVLRGADLAEPARTSLVHHSLDGHFALRAGRWKWIEKLGSGGFTPPKTAEPPPGEPDGQLFDLVADPRETTNLVAERPDVVRALQAELDRLRAGG